MKAQQQSKAGLPDDPPPGWFGSWRNVYVSVVVYLVVLIALFYAFRMVFER